MLVAKPCHAGLKPRSRFLGLEPLDLLLLAPAFYVGSVLLGRPVLAVVVTSGLGVALRLLKWNRLPGYTTALAHFLLQSRHAGAFGCDTVATYPAYGSRGR